MNRILRVELPSGNPALVNLDRITTVTYEADETPGKAQLYFMFDHKNQFLLMGDEALRVWKLLNESEESSSS